MMLKRSTTESRPSAAARLVRAGLATVAALGTVAALATGCLDRPVVPREPQTSNLYVDQIRQTAVDKIDLLFMVDNSASMADKQEILKAAVPVLVNRLVTPICVNAAGMPTSGNYKDGHCPNPSDSPEFNPIGDIHIGIVSSSLGGHGATIMGCEDKAPGNDQAHLIATVRSGLSSWNNSGFLAWDQSGKANTPPGEMVAGNLQKAFTDMIGSVAETGCGYEASLESWYRFLVDPEPPVSVILANNVTVRGALDAAGKVIPTAINLDKDGKPVLDAAGHPVCTNCDETLLAQRRAFLRPDSLVAIVMLSDENDCSIRDDSVGWFVGSPRPMPRATVECDNSPNDVCCRSCASGESTPPAGCHALTDDANCKMIQAGQTFATWTTQDARNLRCYNQHQRFGFDLLYETERYVNALTQKVLPLQSQLQQGKTVTITNPLFDNAGSAKAPRDPSLVFLAGIVGVPWQDIADDASLTGAGLNYLTAKQLKDMGRWEYLIGDPRAKPAPIPPKDPFMIETWKVREGTNTLAKPAVSIVPASSTMPHANVINGHEQNIPGFDDLQFACIFPLATPKDCMKGQNSCDCSPDKNGNSDLITAANSPLCQGGANINQQTSAKAYPGVRELQVLKDLGDNAIVASICPKNITANGPPSEDPNYGYNPAVGAIIARLKEALRGKCLPRPIEHDPDTGQVQCKVIEAQKENCDCGAHGRGPADPKILNAVRAQLKASGVCDTGQAGNECASWCECEILQESADNGDLNRCQTGQSPSTSGYCYVDKDPMQLAKCPANQQQLLRFFSDGTTPTPAPGAVAFIACLGSPVGVVEPGK